MLVFEHKRRRDVVTGHFCQPLARQIGAARIAQQHVRSADPSAQEKREHAIAEFALVTDIAGDHDLGVRLAVEQVSHDDRELHAVGFRVHLLRSRGVGVDVIRGDLGGTG